MWSGYAVSESVPGYKHGYGFYILFQGQECEALKGIQILKDAVVENDNEIQLINELVSTETFWDWHYQSADPVGFSIQLASRLILKENLATSEAKEALLDALAETKKGMFLLVAGKGVQEGDPDGLTSVNPAWRKTVFHYVTFGPQV